MTAEIALLNRSALALAADSAVTIRVGEKQKVYDSAEKIFEFSRKTPIALMIYNTVDHVGVPLDVLVRKYRKEHDVEHISMESACNSFLTYLEDFEHSIGEEQNYLFSVMVSKYEFINQELVVRRREHKGKRQFSFQTTFDAILDEQILLEEANRADGYMDEVTTEQFDERFGEVSKAAAFRSVRAVRADDKYADRAKRYAFAVMKSTILTEMMTGFVFGGFATRDLFPTLRYVEVDGLYFGKLKRIICEEVDIDRSGAIAQIVPFAQTDMADRFIYGTDDEFKSEIIRYVDQAVDAILDSKPRAFSSTEKKEIRDVVSKNFRSTLRNFRQKERRDILDIVNFMSRKELGEMAHALVELTSKKRRFSTEQETVGGPIDVAVVTRNEGFIWIRRKHYFEPDANPGYFARAYGGMSLGGSHGG